MIFGKTHDQKRAERDEIADKLEASYDIPVVQFAFLPRKLEDGRVVWLRRVTKTLPLAWEYDNKQTIENYRMGYPGNLRYLYGLPKETEKAGTK